MTRREFLASLAVAAGTPDGFAGTFLQLHTGHRRWAESDWRALFDDFARLRLERLIVQWTDGFHDLLPPVFAEAERTGMRVDLGLANDSRFWTDPLAALDTAKRTQKQRVKQLRRSVHPALRGFYITEEVDDERWRDAKARKKLISYLKDARKKLKRYPVAISGFANGALPPEELATFWEDLLRRTGIDELLFQDGVGVKKLSIDQASVRMESLRRRLGARVTPVVEIFEQIRAEPFAAQPAPVERIERQLAAMGPRAMVFSVPEYRSPELMARFAR